MNYTIDRVQIKENSKTLLGNNLFGKTWLMALVVCLIQSAILSLCSQVPYVGFVGNLVLTGPLSMGLSLVFMKLVRNHPEIELGDVFFSFSQRFSKDLILGLMITVFTLLWSLLFVIPGIIKSYAYSMAYYISLDHPDWGWKECIDESIRITEGHKGELFVLDLSFIGWYIVGSLCLGVGALWVSPYHMTAQAHYYEALKATAQPTYQAPVTPVQ